MKTVLKFIWGAIKAFHHIVASIFLLILLIAVAGIYAQDPPIRVPQNAALVIAPKGMIVEQSRVPEFAEFMTGQSPAPETELRDILKAIDLAGKDRSIKAIVLDLDRMSGAGAAILHILGDALTDFRDSGKKVYALGDGFSQSQYYLAAHADEIWMHPMGSLSLLGYSSYGPYFAEALDKLKAQVHVFRVGTYKSAVEPFTLNGMSDAARDANRAFLDTLWSGYVADVSARRGFDEARIAEVIASLPTLLENAGGDTAQMVLDLGFVDALKTRAQMTSDMAALLDPDAASDENGDDEDDTFPRIGMDRYLKARAAEDNGEKSRVAVVTLRGAIVPGEAPVDQIGAESAVRLIERARKDDTVKAVVLRVDSPGGSAFASELIRQAVLETQKAGKPVVASFGNVAASGGYWISANADEIWAMPETITGSIGIFGLFLNVQDSLAALGIRTDGVGTTDLAGQPDPTRPLSDDMARILQTSIEDGYEKFLARVAEGRDMSPEDVDAIAQGRVWAGSTAKELGLVDGLGDLEAAAGRAADLAGIEGDWRLYHVRKPLKPFEKILLQLAEQAHVRALLPEPAEASAPAPAVQALSRQVQTVLDRVAWMQDPRGAYALCLVCNTN